MEIGDLLGNELLGQLAFTSIFHVIGGVALGITLRGWVSNPTRENLFSRVFFLIWGGMFGCMPLTFGFQNGLPALAVQTAVLLVAIAVPFFWLPRLRELASDQNIVLLTLGGVFLVVGLAAGSLLLRERQWLTAALLGGIFTLLGGGVFFSGLVNLLRGSPGDE